jgi:SAM-dependent methyltransferase
MSDIAQSPPDPQQQPQQQSLTTTHPDPWVARFASLVPTDGTVLDLACGAGRHTRLFLDQGNKVVAVDRDLALMSGLKKRDGLELIEADIETGPWPLAGRTFDGIVVVNYLHRPLLPILASSLAPGGVLIYRTFGVGNELRGKPSNPNFLLRPNELLDAFAENLEIMAFESGDIATAVVQRVCAIRRASVEPYSLPV